MVNRLDWSHVFYRMTRLESRFLPNDSTRVTINDSGQSHFYKISKHLIDKPSSFAHKQMRFFENEDLFFRRHMVHSKAGLKSMCCDRKSRAACAQSFAAWQQATTEIMFAISLTIACSRYIYNGVILHAHPVRGESHNQRNTTGEVATDATDAAALGSMPWCLGKLFIFSKYSLSSRNQHKRVINLIVSKQLSRLNEQ